MSKADRFKIVWHDDGREPVNAPNPKYPNGLVIDAAQGRTPACSVDLPYPAKRCGMYYVECIVCGLKVGATTAGRVDDPKSLKVPCKIEADGLPN